VLLPFRHYLTQVEQKGDRRSLRAATKDINSSLFFLIFTLLLDRTISLALLLVLLLLLFANRAGCCRVARTDSKLVRSTGLAVLLEVRKRLSAEDLLGNCCLDKTLVVFSKRDLGLGKALSIFLD
jgi:hypothetical protein